MAAFKNILEFRGELGRPPALAEARRKLFQACEKRIHPGRDDKVLTLWNGLMLAETMTDRFRAPNGGFYNAYRPFQVVTQGAPSTQPPDVLLLEDRGGWMVALPPMSVMTWPARHP